MPAQGGGMEIIMNTQPVLLKPAFKDYLWGGTRLRTEYGKDCDLDRIAESWELSAHKDGQSVVASGDLSGKTLTDYIDACGKEILGSRGTAFEKFPILIKFIDAKQKLSVQVHPDDEYALANEGEYGKTEVWYVLSADEGAALYYGFNRKITKDEFLARISDNTVEDVLNRVEAKPGDVFFIKPGTVHAIGEGLLICEIQQNSNTTYRVYDYNRRGADGKLRDLHIDKAAAVADYNPSASADSSGETIAHDGYTSRTIAQCKYFTTERIEVSSSAKLPVDSESFRSVIITDGKAELTVSDTTLSVKPGDSVFVPAQDGTIDINGSCGILLSYV